MTGLDGVGVGVAVGVGVGVASGVEVGSGVEVASGAGVISAVGLASGAGVVSVDGLAPGAGGVSVVGLVSGEGGVSVVGLTSGVGVASDAGDEFSPQARVPGSAHSSADRSRTENSFFQFFFMFTISSLNCKWFCIGLLYTANAFEARAGEMFRTPCDRLLKQHAFETEPRLVFVVIPAVMRIPAAVIRMTAPTAVFRL